VQEVFELVEKVLFMLHQQHQALHADNKQGRQIPFVLIRIQAFCSIRIRILAFAESGSGSRHFAEFGSQPDLDLDPECL
jgi:hypothetical protein